MKILRKTSYVGRLRPTDRPVRTPRRYWILAASAWRPNIGAAFRDVARRVRLALRTFCSPPWLWALLLVVAAGTLFTNPALGQDQHGSVKKIGVLWSGTSEGTADYWGAWVKGLNELGWVEGKTAKFIMRFDNDDKTQLPKLAAELVALRVDVIAVTGAAAQAPCKATTTIPIVVDSSDPIGGGLTKTLSRPIGNVTGVSWQSNESAVKRVELAKELVPGLKHLAVLTDLGDPAGVVEVPGYRAGVASAGIELRVFDVRRSRDFAAAFAAIKVYRPEALIYPTLTLTVDNLKQTVRFALSERLPTFSEAAQYAEAGILLTYGADYIDVYKRAASHVDKILKGAKPANLPWEQPTKFELAVNMKTAKALGLKIPESIMVRATKVIR
jgi:putative tryptophan/tyrosine transport system substrate-binding protein